MKSKHPQSPQTTGKTAQPIVLLEEIDLYKYHTPHHHHQQQYDHRRAAGPRAVTSLESPKTGSSRHHHHPYIHALSSVDTVPLNHGALRHGGTVNLFSRQYIGILLNWALVGFFNGTVPAIASSLLDVLGYTSAQQSSANSLVSAPWLFKFVAGFITDCLPINRQRRKPYLYIGWTAFVVFLAAMAFMDQPTHDGDSQGSRYVIAFMFGSFARLVVMVTCEGLMIECAQREGEFVRGRVQCLCLIFRYIGEVTGTLTIALALNSKEYGGTFAASVPLQLLFALLAGCAACGILITKLLLHEDTTSAGNQRFASHLRNIWSILQQRTTWQITVFGFLVKIVSSYEIQERKQIYSKWLGAKTLTTNLIDAVSGTGSLVAAFVFMSFLLNVNWRKTLLVTVVCSLAVMVPTDLVTVFDVWRNQVLYLAAAQLVGVADALLYILRVVVIIEVVEPGYEAVTYGIITTVYNLATSVVSMTKNVVATGFDPTEVKLELDTSVQRWHVYDELLFKYGLRLVMVCLVWKLLPHQKRHVKELQVRGNPTIVVPIVLFLVFAMLFAASVTSNLLSIFPSTSCLLFAGGKGCN